jgi:hypothetical protein
MLLIAIAAIYRPGPIWLEGHLCLFAAFRASYICHFPGTAAVATSTATAVFILSLKHLIHLPFESIQVNRNRSRKHLNKSLRIDESSIVTMLRSHIYLTVKRKIV